VQSATASGQHSARTQLSYAGRKCRINTYGDSFTLCHQVSDGETWQEYLAAHLGEPVRNFGMGGYGAHQASRRMVREEHTDHNAERLIFYIWGDDHIRSLLRCRHAIIHRTFDYQGVDRSYGLGYACAEDRAARHALRGLVLPAVLPRRAAEGLPERLVEPAEGPEARVERDVDDRVA